MVRIVRTDLLDLKSLDDGLADWIYNGLDCCVTHEVAGLAKPDLDSNAQLVYSFSRAMLAPALEMMLRGTLVDYELRDIAIRGLEKRIVYLEEIRDRYALATWKRPINDKSPAQLKAFFYDYMNLPVQYRNDKGRQVATTNRAALEELMSMYFYAEPMIRVIFKLHDMRKLVQTLKSAVDPDGYMRTSYNVGATETGRWSSSKSVTGRGTNDQNITNEIRRIFIAEERRKFCNIDQEQAESRVVAYSSQDDDYIKACESGDLHTMVAQMVWPELIWPGSFTMHGYLEHFREHLALYKDVAETLFYRHFTYRDIAKRGGHATNYYGQPFTVAKNLAVAIAVVSSFQERYLGRFSNIPEWHREVAERIQLDGFITTCLGRKRDFLGRTDDDATLRKAIAFEPQSVVADLNSMMLWRLWKYGRDLDIRVLKNGHDSFMFSYPEDKERKVVERARELCYIEVPVRGRIMVIPAEVAVGWNWGKYNDRKKKGPINLDGLKALSKGEEDTRERQRPAYTPVLDRVVHGVHGWLTHQ